MPHNKKHLLSKSKYIRGLQCEKALYYDVYCSHLARYDKETLVRFRAGREFEASYKATFTNGIAIDQLLRREVDKYPQRTAELLQEEGEVVLFEAGFLYDDVLVLADVLRKNADGTYDIFEVKNNSELKEVFRHDAAVQHYVISHCISGIRSFNIVNNDGNGGFVVTDILASCQEEEPTIAANISHFKQLLEGAEPVIAVGDHCSLPYPCPYIDHCRKQFSSTWW